MRVSSKGATEPAAVGAVHGVPAVPANAHPVPSQANAAPVSAASPAATGTEPAASVEPSALIDGKVAATIKNNNFLSMCVCTLSLC
jgi:hypothetical protein